MKAWLWAGMIGLVSLGMWLSCGSIATDQTEEGAVRTLDMARDITLSVFREMERFVLEKQLQLGLNGQNAFRLEASWTADGEARRGVIYVIEQPTLFHVVYYNAPAKGDLYDAGIEAFQRMLSTLRPSAYAGPLQVVQDGAERTLRCAELMMELRFPSSWVYALDEVNRAIVFSGPKNEPSWLTTVNISVIRKKTNP